jgi:hypothetical protein
VGAPLLPILMIPALRVPLFMAKNPETPESGGEAASSGRPVRRPISSPDAEAFSRDDLEGELGASSSELDELESRLSDDLRSAESPAGGDSGRPQNRPRSRDDASAPEGGEAGRARRAVGEADSPDVVSAPAPGVRRVGPRRFGASEWAALAGCALLAVVGGILFFKFLYAHPAPTEGRGLPSKFSVPLAGSLVRLTGAEAGWRARKDTDKAAATEVILPTVTLALDPGHASSGFVRLEFIDSDGLIRGDIMTLEVEGGRFKDGGRGEVVAEGGQKVEVTCTVGFRSEALFTSYRAGEEPRWSVRLKEGPNYSEGPWNDLGAASIPNTKH